MKNKYAALESTNEVNEDGDTTPEHMEGQEDQKAAKELEEMVNEGTLEACAHAQGLQSQLSEQVKIVGCVNCNKKKRPNYTLTAKRP